MTNALHELIQRAREELAGPDGRPVTYEWIAERAGVPVSTVHALATRELQSLTGSMRERLAAIAGALGVPTERIEAAAVEAMGYAVRTTYTELDGEHEVLIGAFDELGDDQRRQLVEFARFLRSQSRPN